MVPWMHHTTNICQMKKIKSTMAKHSETKLEQKKAINQLKLERRKLKNMKLGSNSKIFFILLLFFSLQSIFSEEKLELFR